MLGQTLTNENAKSLDILSAVKNAINSLGSEMRTQVDQMYKEDYNSGNLSTLVDDLKSEDFLRQIHGCIGLRIILKDESIPSPIRYLIDLGCVPRLNHLIEQSIPILQLEAAWCLANLAAGSKEETKVVAVSGSIEIFSELLKSEYQDIVGVAVWAFGNLTCDEDCETMKRVIESGSVSSISEVGMKSTDKQLIQEGAWVICNLCECFPSPSISQVHVGIELLCKALYSDEEESVTARNSLQGLLCMFEMEVEEEDKDDGYDKIKRIIHSGVLPKLVSIVRNVFKYNILQLAINLLGYLSQGQQHEKDAVVESGALVALYKQLKNDIDTIQCKSLESLCELITNSPQQISRVMQEMEVIQTIFEIVHNKKCNNLNKREAIKFLLQCVLHGCDFDVRKLVALGVFNSLCYFLKNQTSFTDVCIAFDAIISLLEKGEELSLDSGIVNPFREYFEKSGLQQQVKQIQRNVSPALKDKLKKISQITQKAPRNKK